MKYLIILSILLCSITQGYSQKYNFKTYSLAEGLSRSGVYFIHQANDGYLWIGTDGGGVCKFNSHSFENYTRQHGLASDKVRIIFEDSQKTLWFGTDKGLSFYNGNEFITIAVEDGLSDNFVRSITEDNEGNLWVGTNKGISIIDPSEKLVSNKLIINFTLPHKKVRSVLADSNIVWIGTDGGLCKYENSNFSVITTEDGLINNTILTLFKAKNGTLWIGTEGGLSQINNNKITNWTENDGLINNRVRTITQDHFGKIWLGTRFGISVLNNNAFLNFTEKNGLSNERIRCLTTDNFDNIWIGSYFGGIMRFNYSDFIEYTVNEGLSSNQVLSVLEDENGHIIVGTMDGASKLRFTNDRLNSVKNLTRTNGLISPNVNTIYKDTNGYYWYGTSRGISIINGENNFTISKKDGLIDDQISVIRQYDGITYIGTHNGIAEVTLDENYKITSINHLLKEDGLAGNSVSFIEKHNGDIWIGFLDGKLSILTKDQLINPILPEDVSEINTITFDQKENVWLGTNGRGLHYGTFNKKNKQLELKNISTFQNLSSDFIYSLKYHENKIWIGNEKGIDVVEFITDTTFNIHTYGPERGFTGLQNNLNASCIDSKGNLWFGTVNGLFCYKKPKEKNNPKSNTINFITLVTINHTLTNWTNATHIDSIAPISNLPMNLELPSNMNNIEFNFVALNFIAPNKIKYSWKLKGLNNHWSEPNQNTYASFTNLNPGDYEFMVRSTNSDGVLLDNVVSFKFTITKPIWMSWWFLIIAAIIVYFIIYLILRVRTRQLFKKQKSLENIINIRTQEITQQKDELELTKKAIETQHEQLQYKNKEITDSILYSKRIQNSILPSREKTNNLLQDYFIFYKPKDIVSGDFYWIEKDIKSNRTFVAVADCTGHGVPGAMVSMVGTRALNSSLLEHNLINPNEILNKTNDIVIEAFTDFETGKIIKDGMDIALISYEYLNDSVKLNFSGAQNPIWIVTSINDENIKVNDVIQEPNDIIGDCKLFIVKGTKQPIGHYVHHEQFINNEIELKKGQVVYLLSDGYADQFGGSRTSEGGKKYKYKKLRHFILSIQNVPIKNQKVNLEKELISWSQDLEQIDDICIIGIKL